MQSKSTITENRIAFGYNIERLTCEAVSGWFGT